MTGPMPPDDLGFEDPGFDALDTAIGERLRAAAPTAPNVDATLAGLRPGFARRGDGIRPWSRARRRCASRRSSGSVRSCSRVAGPVT